MPRIWFERTIPVFERAKTFRALDRAATVTGLVTFTLSKYIFTFRNVQTYLFDS
jgi:hypothetical protein